ncbi:MAG: hypothetical protein M1837_007070 [Sclerophora amabilis]|nr:MAG: hypothetical protein M1837_007070 [Sclerophora amabilis]
MSSLSETENETTSSLSETELSAPAGASATLESLLLQSRREVSHVTAPHLECCCGGKDCAFLKHNATALEVLEKDVQTAAQLGQALLARHEAYMAEAEQERWKMSATIEQLETDKHVLQAENARTIEENRGLLHQLEDLNSSVTDADAHVKSLSATLQSTQLELRRLSGLASRASQLEIQLSALEQEQTQLQQTVSTTKEKERSAVQRWQSAERTLGDLEDQIEKIEREAREERERHVEILGRLERRRAVEKELTNAAGRLKGAAVLKTASNGQDGSNVVSHFVKDILQDNANLQLGVVEIREMLLASNEEVENLREQLLLHQPLPPERADVPEAASLGKELESEASRLAAPEFHVHHHYHTPETRTKEKPPVRRPKKRRNVVTPRLFAPPSGTQTPPTARLHPPRPPPPSTATAILSQTSISVPPLSPTSSTNRWSMQSTQTRSSVAQSSVPSSPQSIYRHPFDRAFSDNAADSSRPTSPESNDPSSPLFLPYHRKRGYDVSHRSSTMPATFSTKAAAIPPITSTLHPTAEEREDEREGGGEDIDSMTEYNLSVTGEDVTPRPDMRMISDQEIPSVISHTSVGSSSDGPDDFYAPVLRRSSSNESLVSISGMDIHLSRGQSSHKYPKGGSCFPASLSSTSTATGGSKAVLSAATATAHRPGLTRQGFDSRSYNRSLLRNNAPTTAVASDRDNSHHSSGAPFGKRVGGWVFGKWGVSPMKSTGNLRAKVTSTAAAAKAGRPSSASSPSQQYLQRAAGVNQSGPIGGLRPPPKTPMNVTVTEVNEDLLRESLAEG